MSDPEIARKHARGDCISLAHAHISDIVPVPLDRAQRERLADVLTRTWDNGCRYGALASRAQPDPEPGAAYHVTMTHGAAPCRVVPHCALPQGALLREWTADTSAGHDANCRVARLRVADAADHVGNVYAWGPGVPGWSEHADPAFTPSRAEAGL